ncbi:extracellular tungstate binding [Moniliophthora roreri MCA 2997]|uniref:Extracellular tungstate binding n=2 Tax=Moniliophthora roreri TaxID=221103 RepID=V2YLB4_MONRO|nr:extracellular tungstate binding [Moniliophthora roreri MCA 2997]KAI3607446.1 extracellular tungstate binding [Moniliophthora roreri]
MSDTHHIAHRSLLATVFIVGNQQSFLLSSHGPSASTSAVALLPQAVYNGGYEDAEDISLRIGNGGAGQSGLVGAFADAFIRYCVEEKGMKPFKVAWFLGDTTQTLHYIAEKQVDIGLTYNEAAEKQAVDSGSAIKRELVFLDHFYLVGPPANPAQLSAENDSVTDMFNKIVVWGNADAAIPPDGRPATRFLSRFDKSATNIKESQIFITIGQVPWAYQYSTWYHQYCRFPLQALEAASLLSEYTLTDRGTWLSSPSSVTGNLVVYKAAGDNLTDILLNPCAAVLSSNPMDAALAGAFVDWLLDDEGGQKVVREFKKDGEQLYTPVN